MRYPTLGFVYCTSRVMDDYQTCSTYGHIVVGFRGIIIPAAYGDVHRVWGRTCKHMVPNLRTNPGRSLKESLDESGLFMPFRLIQWRSKGLLPSRPPQLGGLPLRTWHCIRCRSILGHDCPPTLHRSVLWVFYDRDLEDVRQVGPKLITLGRRNTRNRARRYQAHELEFGFGQEIQCSSTRVRGPYNGGRILSTYIYGKRQLERISSEFTTALTKLWLSASPR